MTTRLRPRAGLVLPLAGAAVLALGLVDHGGDTDPGPPRDHFVEAASLATTDISAESTDDDAVCLRISSPALAGGSDDVRTSCPGAGILTAERDYDARGQLFWFGSAEGNVDRIDLVSPTGALLFSARPHLHVWVAPISRGDVTVEAWSHGSVVAKISESAAL